ncbi:glycosyltransferase [Paenibacillus sp. MAH-36]|uniref:Glycosyltransferase n=1 Tax=Paenibacillus violae TaxID=3077234 RepID=A0ABU3RH55_9BACL|nr:glycosyltransferase [Paenibacillus sp. PFR10]MDU0203585.1 glycosyltransferase [Paenibacillus sp. PFR10]
MNANSKVSIVIPFYNCAYVRTAIESALSQTYPNIEIIVVNDGSTQHMEKIVPYMDRIVYVEKENGGTASALNAGIRRATGDYFAWLSSDDMFEPNKVARQLAFMHEQGAKVSYTSYVHMDGQGVIFGGPSGIGCSTKMEFYKTMQKGCIINGCTVMLHMDVFQKTGYFNETRKYTQDYDFWMRVMKRFHFFYLNESLVRYRVHPEMGSRKHESAIVKEIQSIQAIYRKQLDALIAKERLTITFPIITLSIGGAQRMLAEMVNGLAAKGHDVSVLMPPEGAINYTINAKIIRTKQNYMILEKDYPEADVIVSNFYTIVPGAHQASLNGKGVHVRLSLCYEPAFLPENHISFPTYHISKHTVVLSNWQKQLITLNHGHQAHIVPVGVGNAFRNHHIRDTQTQLQISAIMRRPEGGYSWHREQDYLINQLEIVQAKYPQVRINLMTPPEEFHSSPLLQAIKANHPTFRYLTPGHDGAMAYHYNETDIFVNSSTYDSASLPGLEAMRCGAALVTTYNGGNMDYCRHEQNGLMSYRYENRLAADVGRLIEDADLRRRLAAAGEIEASKWTWERSVDAFERVLYDIRASR